MPQAATIWHYTTHPYQLRAMLHWKYLRDPLHFRNPEKESTELKRCYEFLEMTSRSFAAVILELQPEMRVPVALFYLVLRGLDTVEDDMTIHNDIKIPLLQNFHKILDQPGWTFDGNAPTEKDRQLLVEFDVVITEFAKLKDVYKEVIRDIAKQMGEGMAETCRGPAKNLDGLPLIKDYDRYCFYVAGLVGEGLTRLFVPAGFANPGLLTRRRLYISMGLFLQKVNIIRDFREDLEDSRSFYPKEIWGKYVDKYTDLGLPENEEKALACQSELVLNALDHADDCLYYLAGLRDQSVYNFCAIPQVMAIATLALVFRNPDMFKRNLKIPKGEACELMMDIGNLRTTCDTFKKYIKIIRKKNTPKDPNFLEVSVKCAKIEQFIEGIYPTITKKQKEEKREKELKTGKTVYIEEPLIPKGTATVLFLITFLSFMFVNFIFLAAFIIGAEFDFSSEAWETWTFFKLKNQTDILHDVTESVVEAVTKTLTHQEL
ncbi:bifunctional farnesyl-diphosphate farnesyltransferase/squalene synthase [Orbilia oligospora]|uniref:Squalene synthase n=1 Tax=Orbilia oligospora TaxID=2813651 RepID=A0A7C8NSD5_ORBOL|nr:bifunctional farnesyl-diphosphate farnesyltransferase/squalene synthase [Orbilia oligospora]KAF3105357.1 bifunctional farnesyl-diphosphate farnesyltransferase/squalene synthase [Orbilia oligospora]KAF3115086.1 bifunctional farnesyl-diphosphate farnesyltransferase/squalene synthase [Orbilia oligospora]KAF3133391.1 bifunctional farnesyl-diphosphate farnesyltransferase/squalene synthase [Orbilia oligospora]KAF3150209.1 bifunctional farnesyl-diphosphate farnesyltransferase/squalene synthase [Orb